ncbi:YdcF family protein [Amycolatopsis pittospori]|uniref:YdcF family protein n=1 Tax=Amycolatopsis pittospori TaxID=2749434 RepID=UPI0015F08450|nr:ElyC/SanA/YdcF family protein [Amycolatopsis pittospori]
MRTAALPFAIAALCCAAFLVSFLRDRRRLRNGFYLFFALLFLGVTLIALLASVSPEAAGFVALGVLLLIVPTVLALTVFLICTGITMLRREGRSPGNVLSLLTGLGICALIVFNATVTQIAWEPLDILRGSLNGILVYVSFLFVCFLLYSIVYGRIGPEKGVDFIVVLGSGLRDGNTVPPLLASRLKRAKRVVDNEVRRGREPMMVTSGGQGSDEDLPESHAMADYLVEAGVSRERILLEDRSRTTFENLTFSAEIMREQQADYRCTVVTNNFHVLRAALIARRAKVPGQVIGSPTAWYFWPSATIREFVAILVDHKIKNLIICGLIILSQLSRAFT